MEYLLEAKTRVSADANFLIVGIRIARSTDDGETFEQIANFEHRYSEAVTNVAIIADLRRRVLEFVRADSNTIAGAALSERAANLDEAITGTRISV